MMLALLLLSHCSPLGSLIHEADCRRAAQAQERERERKQDEKKARARAASSLSVPLSS